MTTGEPIYIIFIDKKMSGYVKTEEEAWENVHHTASLIVKRKKEENPKLKVYTEETDNGLNIYSQSLGTYMNGLISQEHTIEWISTNPFSYV